ncbi:ribonuclease HII [Candidatus Wolfebacteria bacterium CG18_big_fil_WC_8_21_14_2_50_39_7]|uniref:Ribonuclease HII n=5 Tax=Candidatus Wolfeibacteriota TaxID=1752735 RepID=A0A2M7Q6Q8_9BACT|nr:ribonuclease HII [Parcubacteria group bacterium]NCO89562.1 ribonuclease HII [Candidatus Wolfebacteria bacterium]PIP92276.1 MAG: ribonuclease HII [Candidatus Wolfebacteria bacterium CG18_big_fil_WC_8_21_14_2_50_39_7]PIU98872.1 MAG: ribonuclease HII [Candidatus Wolfebacteria bacterium CG03_land_8_20_14_0_80_39_317]PIY59116.1 MAG: ribonuclease HII [Candidatus Wolfebacteria bacterium CG_4_10_14_0_8_um_filter_39_64]PJB83868.1 MAG: ribonuclease HII [Candidatus Wolfebacteria bacterium CG_4_9_14_0_
MMKKLRYIIGIDEVGRGALAGPVTVAAVAITVNPKPKIRNPKPRLKLRDSKKLTPRQRETWFGYIKTHPGIFYTTAGVSPKIIDKINISNAANLAATRALTKLVKYLTIVKYLTKSKVEVFLDGGLYLNKNKIRVNPRSYPRLSAFTIIKGDEKIPAIMMASIVAKVTRDRIMVKLHKKYPKYAFDRHKGYGTKKHIKAIRKHGPTKVHRLAFLKKIH